MKIKITSGIVEAIAELKDTETAKAICEKLPIEGNANTWGEEIYFEVPVLMESETDAKEFVEKGDIAYWPSGRCFCIFFGKTPASTDERPKAASKVNVFGKVLGDYNLFKQVKNRDKVIITRAD